MCNRETDSSSCAGHDSSASLQREEWQDAVGVLWRNSVVDVEHSVLVHSAIVEGSLSGHDCCGMKEVLMWVIKCMCFVFRGMGLCRGEWYEEKIVLAGSSTSICMRK